MDNVQIIRTQFVNMIDGTATFGVRIFDKNGKDYCNDWTKADLLMTDLEILQKMVDEDIGEYAGNGDGILDWVKELNLPVFIDGVKYEWITIKSIINQGV